MLLIIGMIIGLVLGLTGAGGSVFAVPLLMLLAGMPMADAVGISLGAVAASTTYGSLRNLVQKQSAPLLWKPGAILAGAGALTAPLGKWLGLQITESCLVSGFSLLAMVIALRMWLGASKHPESASVVRAGNFAHTPTPGLLCTLNTSGQTWVYPGHDYKGWTFSTIAEEKAHNPRLQVRDVNAYVELMNNLRLPNPQLMDIAVPANRACGKS